ncbi:phage portal protein [Clostridium perfringens]|nr:phage portal protein [Clostridium perfringens]
MDVKTILDMIRNDTERKDTILEAKKYYSGENDIKNIGIVKTGKNKDPLKNADNRVPHNFHEILVDEKAAYVFTYPVLFDIDDDKDINNKVLEVLGDEFESKSKNLCIEASNAGCAWIHYWTKDTKDIKTNTIVKKEFKYALVKTEQVIPIYDNSLEKKMTDIIRYYSIKEKNNEGQDEEYLYIEHWTDETMTKYKFKGCSLDISSQVKIDGKDAFQMKHELNEIPFIKFANNAKEQSDLNRYKSLIDLYDRVLSGFGNDVEDIQQIIYILENYGGEKVSDFLKDLRDSKAIKVESDGAGSSGSLKTLQIEIPVEARQVILEILKKQIYESGQGLQQDVESVGNSSGVALKFFYRKLELKSGLLETEFKLGFNKLIRAILRYLNIFEYKKIQQTFTRNMISNDLENAQIAQMSLGVIPEKFIFKNHPWIDDPEEAERIMEEENEKKLNEYNNLIPGGTDGEE